MEFPIGFARTTYKRAKQFQEMLEELSCQLPLAIARLYLVTGEKFPEYSDAIYEQIDELQALRKKGIQGEMKYEMCIRDRHTNCKSLFHIFYLFQNLFRILQCNPTLLS